MSTTTMIMMLVIIIILIIIHKIGLRNIHNYTLHTETLKSYHLGFLPFCVKDFKVLVCIVYKYMLYFRPSPTLDSGWTRAPGPKYKPLSDVISDMWLLFGDEAFWFCLGRAKGEIQYVLVNQWHQRTRSCPVGVFTAKVSRQLLILHAAGFKSLAGFLSPPCGPNAKLIIANSGCGVPGVFMMAQNSKTLPRISVTPPPCKSY